MTTMMLLVVVFAAAVVPQALKARAERHQEFLDSIQFHVGAPTGGNDPTPIRRHPSILARRRAIFVFLLACMAVSAVAAVVVPGKVSLTAQLGVDNCFLAYVGLLVRWRDARAPATSPAPAADLVVAVRPALRIG